MTAIPTGATSYEHVPSKDVSDFHKYSDLDGNNKSQHHTLGAGANQASPGNHSHDGGASQALIGIDTSAFVDNFSNQNINGQKNFIQPIVGSISGGDAHTAAIISSNTDAFAYQYQLGNKTVGGQDYAGSSVPNGSYVNTVVYPGLSTISSIVATAYGTSRITCAVISMGPGSCIIQAQNWSGGNVNTAFYINWVAVGT